MWWVVDTIQFHEQSWASQARGKKFQPLVQFSHLPPNPTSPPPSTTRPPPPFSSPEFLFFSLLPSFLFSLSCVVMEWYCDGGDEIPKVPSYKISRGLNEDPRAAKSPKVYTTLTPDLESS